MADVDAADAIIAVFAHVPGAKLLLASTDGDGFIVPADECVATTRKGKQVLNVKAPVESLVCSEIVPGADHVAVIDPSSAIWPAVLDAVRALI